MNIIDNFCRSLNRWIAYSAILALLLPLLSLANCGQLYALTIPALPCCDGEEEDEEDEPRFQTVSRLTLSFAPDGTRISRYESALFSAFSNLLTAQELEDIVLEAFQTWAQHSAVNVGLVIDSDGMVPGYDFGIGGASQGDPRFGDIRIGAAPMAGDVFAVAVPNLDFVSGTWSGDLLFNSNAEFADANQFFAVALHEAGHVLGLGHTTDTTSAMHPTALNEVLNADDIAELKLLYGERIELDEHDDEDSNNNTIDEAEWIELNEGLEGEIPLLVFGDIENNSDVDFFRVEPDIYNGPVTFNLISQKVSLLKARMTVFNETGQVLDMIEEPGNRGSDISLTVSGTPDQRLFVKIESLGNFDTQFGSYALVTTFDDNLDTVYLPLIDTIIRRNYSELDQEEIHDLFFEGLNAPIMDDMHTNDTAATATELMAPLNIALHSSYRIQASIADATDVDYYLVEAQDTVMSVRVNAIDEFGLISDVAVFDSLLMPISGRTIVNGNGELLVEYEGMQVGQPYFIAVSADQPGGPYGIGNYDLNVAFANGLRPLDVLIDAAIYRPRLSRGHTLYVARTQLFHFGLKGFAQDIHPEAVLWMSIYDDVGELKYRVVTRQDELRTAKSVMLRPGSYSVRVNVSIPNSFAAEVQISRNRKWRQVPSNFKYQIIGVGISEPTGPELIDPSEDPFAPCDETNNDFCYPNDRHSPEPFIFVEADEVQLPGSIPNPIHQDPNDWYWSSNWLG
jgi:hypothetical protein